MKSKRKSFGSISLTLIIVGCLLTLTGFPLHAQLADGAWPMTITSHLYPGGGLGQDADWWVAAATPFGIYWFSLRSGWVQSDVPVRFHNGPVSNLYPHTILEISALPVGVYTFYFAIDDDMDALLDATYVDSVMVVIQ